MAKPKSKTNNFNQIPWSMSKELFKEFTLVTEKNKAEVVIKGRILYAITITGNIITYCGFYEVDPRMAKGKLWVSNHMFFQDYSVYITETESISDYEERFKSVNNKMAEKRLYYRKSDKIVKYARN